MPAGGAVIGVAGDGAHAGVRARAPAVLMFIAADVLFFGLLFGLFMGQRLHQAGLFNRSAALLDRRLGVLNTLILVTSSYFVVLALEAARAGQGRHVRRHLAWAMTIGAGFIVTKAVEYADKISHGITMLTNDFYTYYFFLTGLHFLHFAVGMVVLFILWVRAGNEPVDGPLLGWVQGGGVYWHMVDLLWIMLFPLLYLLGSG